MAQATGEGRFWLLVPLKPTIMIVTYFKDKATFLCMDQAIFPPLASSFVLLLTLPLGSFHFLLSAPDKYVYLSFYLLHRIRALRGFAEIVVHSAHDQPPAHQFLWNHRISNCKVP